jgi:predicted secreted protein
MKSLVNWRFVIAVLIIACLSTVLLTAVPIRSGSLGPGEYDAWLDWNDDGKINMMDISRAALAFGTSGGNFSKASLLFDSGWLDLRNETGENYTITHNLNDTELQVDAREITYECGWNQTYGGIDRDWAYAVVQTTDGGYALAGLTGVNAPTYNFWLVKTDASGNMIWNETYGGALNDYAHALVQTSDGGYAIAGATSSFGAGGYDFWLVKVDANGDMQWNQTYGGTNDERAYALVQTSDGGYALAGETYSFGAGSYDLWLVKADALGDMQWNQTYGGTDWDELSALVETGDGGYALVGNTLSFGAGDQDAWLVKTDAFGIMQWNQTYGGMYGEWADALVQTGDGGYALAGGTYSFGVGSADFWLVKTDANGNVQWNMTYGGTEYDDAMALVKTDDGGYALAGWTWSFGAGKYDSWLVKTDAAGNAQWNRTYGGAEYDWANAMIQTTDDGYALAGATTSFGAGDNDFWLVKTDVNGNSDPVISGLAWVASSASTITLYRGATDTNWNYVRVLLWKPRTSVYAAVPPDNPPVPGEYDAWLDWNDDGKINMMDISRAALAFGTSDGNFYKASLLFDSGWLDLRNETGVYYTIAHNLNDSGLQVEAREISSGWNRSYGGANVDRLDALVQASDGGYALAGGTWSFGTGGSRDGWLVKTDVDGNMEWNRSYGGANNDIVNALVQASDGGYALAGGTYSFGNGGFWLIKTDGNGNIEWNQTYGGTRPDEAYALVQTADGGYALAGRIWSVSSGSDFWLVKTDSAGTMEWNNTFSGGNDDEAYALVQTADGGYALAGHNGGYDFWLVKTDSTGNMQWNTTYGGTGIDGTRGLVQTPDGGYAMAGYTGSFGAGNQDFWLVKTDSTGNMQWNRTYGGTLDDIALALVYTSEGGYSIAGYTNSYGAGYDDFLLVKTDADGNIQWNRTYGGPNYDEANALVQTTDGGYALAGYVSELGTINGWLVKTDVHGNPEGSESGLAWTDLTVNTVTLCRPAIVTKWNFMRVRIWKPRTP